MIKYIIMSIVLMLYFYWILEAPGYFTQYLDIFIVIGITASLVMLKWILDDYS